MFDSSPKYNRKVIDAHCHLQEFENPGEVIAGLETVICCGSDLDSSKKAVDIAEKFPRVFATVGCHPEAKAFNKELLLKLSHHKKVVAVGECGLDFSPETREEE
ncbi:MAG: TatD family hydrolase, partial [Patescibacteria group bacterium]